MEKVTFTLDYGDEVDFYVLEQTTVGGIDYILVTEFEEEDGECFILKKNNSLSGQEGDTEEDVYEVVEDDTELLAVSTVFEELLEDVDIVR